MKRIYIFQTILSFLFFIGTLTQLQGATITWLGNYSSAWDNSSNWNSGVPDSTDNIIINSNAPYNLTLTQNRKITNFTINGDTMDLGGYEFTITGTATFNGGKITNGTLLPIGTLCHFGGGLFNVNITATSGYYHMNGGTFMLPVNLTSSTASTSGTGGCVFNDSLTINNTGSYYFTMGSSAKDFFNGPVTINNTSTHEVYLSTSDSGFYNHNIILNSTNGGGVTFGNTGGVSTLASGKTITIGTTGFTNDYLTLKKFKQLGSTSQTLTLTGTAVVNMVNCTFNSGLTLTSPGFLIKDNVFNGATSLTRTASSGNHQSDGGNVFNSSLNCDNQGVSGRIRWATTLGDIFFGNATFNSTGGSDVQLCYTGNSYFYGDLTINSNKVVFNTSNGKVTFAGGNSQTMNGSYNYSFKKLAINKSANHVTAFTTLSVDDSLIFVSGNVITTATNLLTMKHGSKVIGASNSSFVEGPIKKTGNSAFVYPVGKNYSYRPIEISAPSTTTSEFTGEFVIDTIMANSGARDTTLGYLLRNKYWKLNRNSGTSQVYVTLSWDAQNALIDTFVSVASWNGSLWKDLGKHQATGNASSGTVKSNTLASSYTEFTIGYQANSPRTASLNCNAISDAVALQACLVSAGGSTTPIVYDIIQSFSLDDPAVVFPLPIQSGVTLQGSVGGVPIKWWESGCHLLTSSHTFSYKDAICMCQTGATGCVLFSCQPETLYLFTLQPGATIQNLRIRGANCNVKDFNEPDMLCGGIYVYDSNGSLDANILNCEISCFSQAGVWKDDETENLNIANSYIHKVKGRTKTGIGYGVWTQSLYTSVTPQEVTFHNNIFDDCKTAIDGQAKIINWTISNCSLTQFFSSEDINMHNNNEFTLGACPCSNPLNQIPSTHYFYDYMESTDPQKYFGEYWAIGEDCEQECANVTVVTNPGHAFGELKEFSLNGAYTSLASVEIPEGIPFYDVGGIQTTIENSIFHKKWKLDDGQSNINLNYPNRDSDKGGSDASYVHIVHNTFTMEEMTQAKLDVLNQSPTLLKNRGGFARISDNSINADVWNGDTDHIVHINNNFSYVPGMTFSNSPIPCSNQIELTTTGNVVLPGTHTKSSNVTQPFIQYVDLNTAFKINTISNAPSPSFIIRPNPNENALTGTTGTGVISNENYFHDQQTYTSDASTTFSGYDKPGLYGIDVLAFDVEDYDSGTLEEYNFRSSAWNHIPIIVKGAAEQTLYFNIKDSYEQDGATTGVKKQAYLNDLLIWSEDVAEGGSGWEYVEVDLNGLAANNITEIFSALKTDGTKNILSFSILIESGVSSTDVAGVNVWVDDIYIPITGSINGENLVKDGTVELTEEQCPTCDWFINTSGNTNVTGCGSTSAGINGNEKKSGSQAIYLYVPFETTCTFTTSDRIVASMGTCIDFTDLLDCGDYTSSPFNFVEMDYLITTTVVKSGALFMANDVIIEDGGILTLSSCSLVVMPHTPPYRIIIEDGGTLILESTATDSTHIFACGNMWGGIESTKGTIYSVTSFKSIIEDAITAVDCEGGNVQIRNIEFKNCLQSFNLHATSTNTFTTTSFVRGCKFHLSHGALLKSPHEGEIPFAHMRLDNITNFPFPIGNNVPGLKNEFYNATNGIFVRNSLITLYNNYFYDIHSIDPINSGVRNYGRGVYILNSTLTGGTSLLGGTGTSEDNFFENVNIGIQIYNSCPTCNYTITNNHLDNTDYGDTGIGTSFYNTAITVQSPLNISGPIVEIFDNTILNSRIGIHGLNVSEIIIGTDVAGTLIAANTIEFDKSTFPLTNYYEGIWLQNCTGARVANNYVFNSTENEDLNFRGLDIETSADCFLNCNTIDKIGVAINIYDDCGTTKLRSNSMSNFFTGVWLNGPNGASIDVDQGDASTQDSWGNEWNWQAAPSLKVDGAGYGGAQTNWYYEGPDASSNILSPRPWNANIVNPIPATGTAGSLCTSFFRTTPNRHENFGPVVGDSAIYAESEDNSRYLATQNSYIAMKNDSTLVYRGDSLDVDFESFFLRMDSSNVGKFQKVRELATNWPDSAKVINALIADSNDIEFNLKTFNALYFDKLIYGTEMNSTDSTFLDGLLSGSYITVGESFYNAAAAQSREIHPVSYSLRLGSTVLPDPIIAVPVPKQAIKIFPNPANSSIKVELLDADDKIILIELYSSLGNLIIFKTCNSNLFELNIQSYQEGLYKLRAFTQKGFSDTKTFSIVR